MSPVSMTPKSPSLAGSDGEHRQSPTSSPALGATSDIASAAPRDVYSRLNEHKRRAPRTLSVTNDLVEDVGLVDYESDNPFPAWYNEESELHQQRDTSPARALQTACPFPDFSSTEERGSETTPRQSHLPTWLDCDNCSSFHRLKTILVLLLPRSTP
ncbi:uncharacterized protein PHALS_11867 [Plasmopara halstedii]|uniref:Uncharacterized protein n=1 Tax=Plasmopara halstedii TaxID=4781 RepID=A0A0P1ALG5_PLAHL|nr:uncharacterized protein PHALS_11867 [Plasmopara halstedii]CEG41526.1 hypothetical protein PHALS_11867 [Plasmopara halstedii]|eukprot:XP_024577895.1 hypothetical protein PHALS_11867 [Plasmopara halstedii]